MTIIQLSERICLSCFLQFFLRDYNDLDKVIGKGNKEAENCQSVKAPEYGFMSWAAFKYRSKMHRIPHIDNIKNPDHYTHRQSFHTSPILFICYVFSCKDYGYHWKAIQVKSVSAADTNCCNSRIERYPDVNEPYIYIQLIKINKNETTNINTRIRNAKCYKKRNVNILKKYHMPNYQTEYDTINN